MGWVWGLERKTRCEIMRPGAKSQETVPRAEFGELTQGAVVGVREKRPDQERRPSPDLPWLTFGLRRQTQPY